jgi:predicted nuclease of predicted toxin-antitoxin system
LDAQISPVLAGWLKSEFGLDAVPIRDLSLRDASDVKIFEEARKSDAVVLTKDSDFPDLVRQKGAPPRVIWLRTGNSSNSNLQKILATTFPTAMKLIEAGEEIIEISG